jgi:hypothetical protein
VLQLLLEIVFTLLVGVFAAVLAVNLGSGDALMVGIGLLLLWQLQQLVELLLEMRRPAAEEPDPSPSPMPTQPLTSHFLTRQTMLLPSVRELRRANAGAKKAW